MQAKAAGPYSPEGGAEHLPTVIVGAHDHGKRIILVATCAHPAEDGRLHILETAVPAVIVYSGDGGPPP
jgi:hypothetical protein